VSRVLGLDVGPIDAVSEGLRRSERESAAVSSDSLRLIEGGMAYIMFRPVIDSVAHSDAAGSGTYALLLVRASDLAPPPASLLPQVRYTISHLGNVDTAPAETALFESAAEPADAVSRALLPTLRFTRELTGYSQPLRLVLERQLSLADLDFAALTLAGFVSLLSLALLFTYLRAQMKARAEIESLALRLQTLAAGTFEGVVLTTSGGVISDANEQLARILGYEREQVIGRRAADFVFAEDRERVAAGMSEGLAIRGFEHRIQRPDGALRTVEVNAQNIELAGRPMRLAAIRDITEKKQAEEELRSAKNQADRARNAMSHFLAAVSHDLRQPVYALSLFFAEIEKKKAAADPRLYANMRDCIVHLDEMFGNLLDLSRMEAGGVVAEVCVFELAPILARIVASCQPETEAKGLSLRLARFDASLHTDPVLFQRIVSNLIANAIRYTGHGGVLIGCRRHRGGTWLEVWDSGIGIAPERIGEIFEEFKQLGNPERDRTKGSGLGLSIVDKTATLLGLRLRVRSRPGRGSLFAVELPLAAGSAERIAVA
jgi:PAS domain S-box-containing protein